MQLPKRKPGKYAHHVSDPSMTQKKYDDISADLERLKKKKIYAAKEVKRTAANGDFSENAAYQAAKGMLRGILSRIDILTEQLNRAVIIKKGRGDKVEIGSTVTVQINGKEKVYSILGSTETDPSKGIISQSSPLGGALIGKMVGDTAHFMRGKTQVDFTVVSIQ